MQNEKYFYDYYNKFEYNHDFEKNLRCILGYEVLDRFVNKRISIMNY